MALATRFAAGAVAYGKDGKRYTVDEAVHGLVYCHSDNGAEVEFSDEQLTTAAEWSGRGGIALAQLYERMKHTEVYARPKGELDKVGSELLLKKAASLFPGMLDFAAFETAKRALADISCERFLDDLSIIKCRAVFDAAAPETRATLLANLVGASPERLVSAARIGDNLTRAMIEKGLNTASFEAFGSRRRQ